MRTRFLAVSISSVALLTAGCDPEAPVQSSDVSQEIDSAVAVHAADSTTHTNLLLPASNVSGEFDSDQIADGAIGNSELDINSVGSEEIADGTIALLDMGAGSVGTTQIIDGAITSLKIAAGSIGPTQLAANSIGAGQIADGAISGGAGGELTDNSVGTADIQNDSVGSLDLAADSVTSSEIAADAVGSAEIGADQVGSSEIAADAVDTAEIAAMAVTAGEIATDAVVTAKIMDGNVTTAKIADGAVAAYGAKLSIPDTLGSGTNNDAAFNTVFTMRVPSSGTVVRVVAGCESDKAASQIRVMDNNQTITMTCPDTNLMGPMSLFILEVTTNMAAEDVLFKYNSEADGDTTRWRIFSVTAL